MSGRVNANGFLLAMLLLTATTPIAADFETRTPSRPNIIHILADDLGWGAVGFNGAKIIKTPNLDEMASNGLRFTSAYVTYPACAPTRASLLTGFHSGHAYIDSNSEVSLRHGDTTVAELLSSVGYETAIIGKWGFGGSVGDVSEPHSPDLKNALRSNPRITDVGSLPQAHGYQYFFGLLNHTRAHSYFVDSLWEADILRSSKIQLIPTGNSIQNGRINFTHDIFMQRARQYIKRVSGSESPFYLQLNLTIPHDWISDIEFVSSAIQGYEGTALPRNERNAAALVTYMDRSISDLLDVLKDPDGDGDQFDSVLPNTIIFFSSDNGLDWLLGEPLFFNGPFRGGKWELYEGGIRVPFFAYWVDEGGQSRIKVGSTEYATDIADLMPTFLDLAGANVPIGIDGASLLPVLFGRNDSPSRPYLYFENNDLRPWVEDGTEVTILHRWAVLDTSSRMKLIHWESLKGDSKEETSGYELYDLRSDPGETVNLLKLREDRQAEIYAGLLRRLSAAAELEGAGRDDAFTAESIFWTGPNNGDFMAPRHWSGANAPAENCVSSVINHQKIMQRAVINSDIQLLGLEVAGDRAKQEVELSPKVTIQSTNGIKIGAHGTLVLRQSTLRSSRDIRVLESGNIMGAGSIEANLNNDGTVAVYSVHDGSNRQIGAGSDPPGLEISRISIAGNYFHSESAKLIIGLPEDGQSQRELGLQIMGKANIHGGSLTILSKNNTLLEQGTEYFVIAAKEIAGQFFEISLPSLDDGLVWDTRGLYRDGVIRVVIDD